ncbi:hypothetical protein VTJ04DRAFT_9279 [Mycothermus thermophilus]|uniref:uncharacterized protein n=1 Tax=Humicola insolens TaxID=85995 RepID=UPI0037448F7C
MGVMILLIILQNRHLPTYHLIHPNTNPSKKNIKIKNHVVTDKVLRTNLSETQTGHRHRHREVRPERQRPKREETTPTTTTGIREKPKNKLRERETRAGLRRDVVTL